MDSADSVLVWDVRCVFSTLISLKGGVQFGMSSFAFTLHSTVLCRLLHLTGALFLIFRFNLACTRASKIEKKTKGSLEGTDFLQCR